MGDCRLPVGIRVRWLVDAIVLGMPFCWLGRLSFPLMIRGIEVVPVYFHHIVRTRLKQHFPAVGSGFHEETNSYF